MKKLLTLLLISILIFSVTVSMTSCDAIKGLINGDNGNDTGDTGDTGDDNTDTGDDNTGDNTGDDSGNTEDAEDDFEYSDDTTSGTGGIPLPIIPAPPASTEPEADGESAGE